MDIPLIDIGGFESHFSSERDQVVRQWRDALDTLGFVAIRGHGIPETLMSRVQEAGRAFFEQPADRKLPYMIADVKRRGRTGYIPLKGEAVGRAGGIGGVPDLSESLTFGQPALGRNTGESNPSDENIWPDRPTHFRDLVELYADRAYALGLRLMRISALALGLEEDHFFPFYAPMLHRLRFAYYPDQPEDPEPGQLRNAAHTDFAGFTILLQDDAPGGLQVQSPAGEWIDVPATPGTLIINTGDLIQRWTNDRWISNVHRVVNPPRDHKGSTSRLSLVFFTGPSMDSEIACIPSCCVSEPARYAPIRAGDHVQAKIALTYGAA